MAKSSPSETHALAAKMGKLLSLAISEKLQHANSS